MGTSLWRRMGAVLAIAVLLSVALVPAASASAAVAPSAGSCSYYIVRPGDNLTRIAARYRTTVWTLQQQNHISNPDRIYIGQRLKICKAAPPPPPPVRPCPPAPCCQPCVPVPPPPPAGPWTAQYFNNRDLSGSPVLTRNENNVGYNWGYGSPAPQVTATNFSARWQRSFNMTPGTYRVTLTVDDGVRVSIDNVLVINAWQIQAATTYTQDVIVSGGSHLVTIEYFQAEGVSQIQFSMPKVAN